MFVNILLPIRSQTTAVLCFIAPKAEIKLTWNQSKNVSFWENASENVIWNGRLYCIECLTQSGDDFFATGLNKLLNKQSNCR